MSYVHKVIPCTCVQELPWYVWSKALPSDCSLSLTIAQIWILLRACDKVSSDLWSANGFSPVLLNILQLSCHNLALIWQKNATYLRVLTVVEGDMLFAIGLKTDRPLAQGPLLHYSPWSSLLACYDNVSANHMVWMVSFNWPHGACEKVAGDLGLGGGFCQVLQFPPPITTG